MKSRREIDNPLLRKLSGFQKAPRDRFFLLHIGELTQEELILYELGVAITDWDPRHERTYGTFFATNAQLAEMIGVKSDSTISRVKKKLFQKEYFILREDGSIEPKDFKKWELRRKTPFSQT